ncbi:MAG: tetratricopeptide repeat protein [Patescibacteria group bacterium]
MFIILPLAIFLISIAAIFWLAARKFVYLKKLAPGIIDNSDVAQESFWAEFFPEGAQHLKMEKLQGYAAAVLAEFEKLLRRLRLISLRIDTFMSQLVHKVRKSNARREETLSKETGAEAEKEVSKPIQINDVKKDLKEEEQRLIIEIAKNPKDAGLYKKLGQIYLKTGDSGDAFESFKKALELDPEDAETKIKLDKISARLEKSADLAQR